MTRSKRKRLERKAKKAARAWVNRRNNKDSRAVKKITFPQYLEHHRRMYRLIPCPGVCTCFKGQWIVDGVRYPSRSAIPDYAEAEIKQAEYTASFYGVPVFWQDFEEETE